MYRSRLVAWGDTRPVRKFAQELLAHLGCYRTVTNKSARLTKALRLVYDNITDDALRVIMDRQLPGLGPDDGAIEEFVRDAVALAAPHTAYSAYLLTSTAAPYVLWCVKVKGWPLNPSVIWAVRSIDNYALTANLDKTEGTRSNYKGRLLRISEVLLPEQHPKRSTPLTKRRGPGAYTQAEIAQFRVWAGQQVSELNHDRAMLMMSLCAGAGVHPGELAALRHEHIIDDEQGMLVRIPGEGARDVPLLSEWEPWLRAVVKRRPAGEQLWGPINRRNADNLTSAFTERSNGKPPRADRLRWTWIAHHLHAGTPMKELSRAAGIKKWQHLHLLLEVVPAHTEAEYRRLLRSEGQA